MKVHRIDPPRTYEEQYLYEAIASLRREFEAAAKPYMDRLVSLASIKDTKYCIGLEDSDKTFADRLKRELENQK